MLISLIQRFWRYTVEIVALSKRVEAIRIIAEHFFNTAFCSIPDFIVNDGFQLFSNRFLFCSHIRGAKSSIVQSRFGDSLPQKIKALGKQRFIALHERIINRIHTEGYDLIIAAFINIEPKASPIEAFQLFAKFNRFRIRFSTSPKYKRR
ncbi:hypothetical protein D3C74_334250 [compost metagenome]